MKNRTLLFIYAILIINIIGYSVTSCSVSNTFSVSATEVDRLRNRGFTASAEELENGYKSYVKRCGNCHHLTEPGKYTMSEWQLKYLPTELEKAKVENEAEKKTLSYYIFSKAK